MAQFDLLRHSRSKRYPFLLDVQADLLRDLATRIVAPLTSVKRLGGNPIGRLNPVVTVEGAEYAILFQELAALPKAAVGEPMASLRGRRDELIAALDLLFTGI
ncbi:MAG TPA: CcdB family protein [Candidatus Binatia bacterium]|nr:CcdB family protein [Candidatus Binatia bacterium]